VRKSRLPGMLVLAGALAACTSAPAIPPNAGTRPVTGTSGGERCRADLATMGQKVAMPISRRVTSKVTLPTGERLAPVAKSYVPRTSAAIVWKQGRWEKTATYQLLLGRLLGPVGSASSRPDGEAAWVVVEKHAAGLNRDTGACMLGNGFVAFSASTGHTLLAVFAGYAEYGGVQNFPADVSGRASVRAVRLPSRTRESTK